MIKEGKLPVLDPAQACQGHGQHGGGGNGGHGSGGCGGGGQVHAHGNEDNA